MELTNQLKKQIRSLNQLKFRQKYNNFIAEGPTICHEYLRDRKYEIEYIICTEKGYKEIISLSIDYPGKTIVCKDKELAYISNLKTPNEILIVAKIPESPAELAFLKEQPWLIYLDAIRDPGNMGTIIRIADWFGIGYLAASRDSVDFYNPKVIQSAMGSHNRIRLMSGDFTEIRAYYEHSYAFTMKGQALASMSDYKQGIIVIGNESRGISPDILSRTEYNLQIEGGGGAESLNASVACGIACYQLLSDRFK